MPETKAEIQAQNYTISSNEHQDIAYKIEYEIVSGHYKMLKLGAFANIIGGFLYYLVMYSQTNMLGLTIWYVILFSASLIDVLWAVHYETPHITLQQLQKWRKGFLVIVACLCLTWGSIGILFGSGGNQANVITIIFLLAVLISFGFSTIMDFPIASISIWSILLPTVVFTLTKSMINIFHGIKNDNIDFAISFAFLVLGIFLTVASYIGQTVIRKFFKLNFENALFSEKLQNMNKELEDRVKQRTAELENSLSLVEYQATHDLLTELPNSISLGKYIEKAIEIAKSNNTMFALSYFSINGMTKIIDGLGPAIGDLIIKLIGQRLYYAFMYVDKSSSSATNTQYIITISRKDDFVILIDPVVSLEDAEMKANALFTILHKPIHIEKQILSLTASVGLSIYPRDGQDVRTIMVNADIAKVVAMQMGGNYLNVYQPKSTEDLTRQIDIENQLPNAVKNNEFILQYQPIIDLKTNKIICAEVLIRWFNVKYGLLYPGDFITMAETNGMIIPIGNWVLLNACRQIVSWHQNGFPDIKISVNLSYKQLLQKNIVNTFINILAEAKIDPKFVEFELLERQAFQTEAMPILKALREKGIGLAVDDFGTGYSALSSLKLFQIEKIKIDKSFVQDITTSSDSRHIIINTILLAKSLNASVVAEGVETKEQLKFLQENGCNYIQGYYFSRPINADAFYELLKNQYAFISSKQNEI